MTLFESLFLAHILGDWILQTEWQAVNKSTSWRALLTHVFVYHVVILVVLGIRIGWTHPLVYEVVLALAVTHILLDRFSVVPLMRALRITVDREPDRVLELAVDQSVHLLLLGLATLLLTHFA